LISRQTIKGEKMSNVLLYDAELITPFDSIEHGAILIDENGKILSVGFLEDFQEIPRDTIRLRLTGKRVLPGLIDVHVHGGYGANFGTGDLLKDLRHYSREIVQTGVTAFLPSVFAETPDGLVAMIKEYVRIFENEKIVGAQPIGLHLEGPFLNPEKKGAFTASWLRLPNVDEAKRYLEAGKEWIKQITIAPELPRADEVATLFRQAGVVVAMGHTNADYETATKALRGAFNHITHTFNAQRGFDHRAPGVFGAILSSDLPTAELIADNIHVHPASMKLLERCVGVERIVLITDAIAGTGLPDGEYNLMTYSVKVVNGKVTLPDGTLAGSTAKLNQCVCNAAEAMQVSFCEAAQMASLNPAQMMGVADERGSLVEGKRADITVLDDSGQVCLTIVAGEIVYNNL
jgi:N-acetylglucosamine-6-phosphate deacetylase